MKKSFWQDFLTYYESSEHKNPILLSILRTIKPEKTTDTEITLACENFGAKIFLEKKQVEIEQAVQSFLDKPIRVQFTLQEKKKKKEEPLFQFQPSTDDILVKAGLNPKHTFDNFAVSSSNQVAFAAAQSVVQNLGSAYNPLFLHGGVGVGKTHLTQALARTILERDGKQRVFFCPGDQFTNELIEAIREKSTMRFRKKYRHLQLLIIDDIQFIAGKQTIQEEFFHTFNTIVSAGGQIILNSDRPPHEIRNLEDRLRSRFSGGLIVDVQPPDFELRTAILLIKAREKNIGISIDAAKIIAEQVEDTRALEGTLLSAYARILGKQETIDLNVVDDFFNQNKKQTQMRRKITPGDVIKTVCSYYDIKQSQIKGKTRLSSIAHARQVTMYLLREEYKLKLEEVAIILKRKDHTTIIHGVEKISRMVMKDPQVKEDVDRITSTLQSST